MPGAPIAWVTTSRFLEVFALGSLRDLPELDALAAGGAKDADEEVEAALDEAFGLMDEEGADEILDEANEVEV
jgi:hypothetical protein